MNACPGDDALFRFLEGQLDVDDDARIVGHVEGCVACQDRLEHLTRRRPDPGDESTGEAACDVTDEDVPSTVGSGETADMAGGADTEEAVVVGPTVDRDGGRTDPGVLEDGTAAPAPGVAGPPDFPVLPGYEVLQRLGEGGMGVVYRARQRGLNRLIALKMIRGGSQARRDSFERFRIEAESVARLRHPNIIQIYDIGEAGGLPFVALELLEGGSLDARLAGNPQQGLPSAELMMTLARAVQVAHAAGIIHRDLKPANVLYSSDGVPKITDFGLAKRVDADQGQTQSGQILGSPSYMAPEQARGDSRKVGPAADVYALGAILYEMLTGRPPFKGETPIETVRQVIDTDPVNPSRLVPRVPRDLETISLKCLHKDPARRYESARALADDLKRYLDGEPITARRTPSWERGAKWARRRPLTAVAGVVAFLAFVGAIAALFAYQESRLSRDRRILVALTGGFDLERKANSAQSPPELRDVQLRIASFLPQLKAMEDDPRIKDLQGRLEWERDVVGVRLEKYQSEQAERERLAAEGRRHRYFLDLLNEAFFRDTHFTGLDLDDDREATRRAAVAALDVYAAPGAGHSWTLGTLRAGLSPPEQAEIADGCYALLLVLSQVEKPPERGLHRLEQAARLRPPTRAYHLRKAACLARAGDQPAADRERRAAESLSPATAFDHFLAGKERFDRQDFEGANEEFDMALRLQPDHFWAHALSAVCWLTFNQPVEAKASLYACLQREPGFAWLYILRGFASGQIALIARDGVEKPSARGGTVDRLYALADSDYRRAQDLLDRGSGVDLRYGLLVNRGVLRLTLRRDLGEAVEQLEAAIRLNSRGLEAHAALAKVFHTQGRLEDAVQQYGRAIALSPGEAALYRDRARVELGRASPSPSQRSRALSDLEQAIRLEQPGRPELARDHVRRARLLAFDHRDAEALAACEDAIKVVGDDEEAHRLRLDLLLKLRRHDDVIRSCDPLIARGKASAAIYERRGLAREQVRDLPGAIEDFTGAMAVLGDRPKLLRRRGWAYIVADAPRLALPDFQEAIRLDPYSGDAHNGRGSARLRFGEHREAVADAERAISIGEPTPDLFYKAARVYALAAVVVSAEVRKWGQESALLVKRYQDRAVVLVREAMKRLPVDRRPSFWRDAIQADPALSSLRRRIGSPELAGPVTSGAATRDRRGP